MKQLAMLAMACMLWACGDEKEDERERAAAPGSLYEGLAGGRTFYQFPEEVLSVEVSGTAAIRFAQGVFIEHAFPAEITFSVREPDGDVIAAAVTFPSVKPAGQGLYEGSWENGDHSASIQFQVTNSDTLRAIELLAFNYREPFTTTAPSSRRVRLAGQLRSSEAQLLE